MNVIRIKNLGKRYMLGPQLRSRTLREDICRLFSPRPRPEAFWALRHFSLDIRRGDRLGIIGGNGSGKSTLLKILGRITTADEGRAELRGRVASMLEVGTGFHPELSGRENVFLNGAVLGMTRNEIRSRFDDIVDFAGVGKFIDVPVKRYSSGMYVRLAFAVAAHLDSELLLLDEVLAVGDAEFQNRCIDKMRSITSDEGRTIIFVSHNMLAVQSLCNRAVVLREGRRISETEDVGECVDLYLRERLPGSDRVLEWTASKETFRHQSFTPLRMSVSCADGGELPDKISTGDALRVDLWFEVRRVNPGLYFDFMVSAGGAPLFSASPWENRREDYKVHQGENHVSWHIPKNLLNTMNYCIKLRAAVPGAGGFRMAGEVGPMLRLPIDVCDYRVVLPVLGDRRLLHPELEWEIS